MAGGVELATAYISLSASTRGLGQQINRAMGAPDIAAAGDKAGKSISSRLGGALKKGAIGVGAAAGGVLATALFKGWGRLTNIENATAKLTGLGHSAGSVKTIMDNALKSVRGTAFGLDEAATVAAGAVASGIKPGKALTRTLTLMADAATIGGSSMSEMGAIFNKVAASGKIQGDVINQLSDQGIPILQLLSKQLGVSTDDILGLTKKGKVSFEDFQNAMEMGLGGGEQAAKNLAKQMGISVAEVKKRVKSGKISADQWAKAIAEVGGASQKSGETTVGAFKNMGAAMGRFGATLLKGVYPMAKTVFGGITVLFDKMAAAAGPFVEKVSLAIQGIFDLLVKGDYTNALSKSLGIEEDSAIIEKFYTISDAVGRFVDDIKSFWKGLTGAFTPQMIYGGDGKVITAPLDGMVSAGKKIRELFLPLWDAIKGAVEAAWPAVKDIAGALWQTSQDLGVSAWDLFTLAVKGVTVAFEKLTPYLKDFAEWVRDNEDKVKAIAVGFVAFGAAMKAATVGSLLLKGAVAGLNVVMRLNPAMLVVAGLAALAYWFVDTQGKGETFRDKLLDVWNRIQEKVQGVIDWFKGFWNDNGAKIKADWDNIWNGIKVTFESVWLSVQAIATSVGGWLVTFWENWGGRITEFFRSAWDHIKRIIDGALQIVRGIFQTFAGLFTGDWGRMWDGLKSVFQGAWKVVSGAVGLAIDKLKLVLELAWAAIKSVAGKAWDGIVGAIRAVWDGLIDVVKGPIDRAMQFVQENFIDKINAVLQFVGIAKIKPIWTPGPKVSYSGSARNSGKNRALGGGDRGTPQGGSMLSMAASMSSKYVSPVGRPPSFPWGRYPSGGRHNAYDYATPVGTPVRAPYGASVIAAGWDSTGFGNHVRTMDADGRYSIFGHLSSIGVSVGQRLAPGQVLGRSGNSGNSTGPHLHWERRTSPYAPGTAFNPDGAGAPPGSGGGFVADVLSAILRSGVQGAVSLASSGLSAFGWLGNILGGVVKRLGTGAVNWALERLGLDAGGQNRPEVKPLLFDSGGILPTGISVVKNATGRPEPLKRMDGGDGDVLGAVVSALADLERAVYQGTRDGASDGIAGVASSASRQRRQAYGLAAGRG